MFKLLRRERWKSSRYICFFVLSYILIHLVQKVNAKDVPRLAKGFQSTSLTLAGYSPYNQVSWSFETLPSSSALSVRVDSIPSDISFVIFQAHAFLYNISLSYNASLIHHYYVNGSNTGLIWQPKQGPCVFHVFNDNVEDVTVMLAVVAYNAYAPIPGGCNMEFDVETAPYLQLQQTDATLVVNAQAAKSPESSCVKMAVDHDMYRMYLKERDFTEESYFKAILSMMTPKDLVANGTLASVPVQGSTLRRVYSLYPGTGSVYVTLARSSTGEAAYVPALTYGCSALFFSDSCTVLNTTFSKVFSAMVFFLGLFACFFGHSFFKTELFLAGCLAGGLVSFIAVRHLTTLSSVLSMSLATLVGATTGMVWLLFWSFYGIPVVTIMLLSLTLGFVFASIIVYAGLGDMTFAQLDAEFWLVFCCLMLSVAVLLLPLSHHASIIVSTVLGSYAVVMPIDHYVGGNLKYIIINTLRRATVSGFAAAIIDPPFQERDGLLVALWAVLAAVGGYTQTRRQRGRPPFVAGTYQRLAPRSTAPSARGGGGGGGGARHQPSVRSDASARTPLRVSSYIPYGSVGDDDVFETPPHERRRLRPWEWVLNWWNRNRTRTGIGTRKASLGVEPA